LNDPLAVNVVQLTVLLADIWHSGKAPTRKSFSTALVDCEERVSKRKLAKQGALCPLGIRAVRSIPPS